MENKLYMCQSVESYLMKTLKNLEENESISINRSINDTWNFITDIKNQKLLLMLIKFVLMENLFLLISLRKYMLNIVI
jgi:hypothetical protein